MRALLAVLMLLVFVSPASAWTEQGEAAALSKWGPVPNCPSITFSDSEPMPIVDYGRIVMFVSATIPCTVFYDSSWVSTVTPDRVCTVIEHELGHLHGLPHTDEGVMNRIPAVSPECTTPLPAKVDPRRPDGKPRTYTRRSDRKWCRRNAKLCVNNYVKLATVSLPTQLFNEAGSL